MFDSIAVTDCSSIRIMGAMMQCVQILSHEKNRRFVTQTCDCKEFDIPQHIICKGLPRTQQEIITYQKLIIASHATIICISPRAINNDTLLLKTITVVSCFKKTLICTPKQSVQLHYCDHVTTLDAINEIPVDPYDYIFIESKKTKDITACYQAGVPKEQRVRFWYVKAQS